MAKARASKMTFNALFRGVKPAQNFMGIDCRQDDSEGWVLGVEAGDFTALYEYHGTNDRSFMQHAADAVPERLKNDDMQKAVAENLARYVSVATPDVGNAEAFLTAYRYVSPAISGDLTRYNLHGVCLDAGRMVATDGHRLHLHENAVPAGAGMGDGKSLPLAGTILPAPAAAAVANALNYNLGWGATDYRLGFDGRRLTFRTESGSLRATIAVRLTDGQFPAYTQVMPSFALAHITVTADRKALAKALESVPVELMGGKRKHIRFQFDHDGNVWPCDKAGVRDPKPLPARAVTAGWSEAAWKPAPAPLLDVKYDLAYLLELLDTPEDGEVTLRLEDHMGPLALTKGDAYGVQMPINR